ncbi:MAG: hypothetical protein JJU11_02625 [Candidatus Sumerlaeia bacterium]|nr:hypothetical protein [Candidatus Sumerlaeia bacterium]
MTPNRIMLINGMLFLVVVALSVLIMTEERLIPEEPPISELEDEVTYLLTNAERQVTLGEDRYGNIGNRNIFSTIKPLPTPSPSPTPTPKVPPNINEVTEYWKLGGMLSTMAMFQDMRTREDFQMRPGDVREIEFRREKIPVELESIDRANWRVTIKMNYEGNVQRREMKMF